MRVISADQLTDYLINFYYIRFLYFDLKIMNLLINIVFYFLISIILRVSLFCFGIFSRESIYITFIYTVSVIVVVLLFLSQATHKDIYILLLIRFFKNCRNIREKYICCMEEFIYLFMYIE